MTNNLTQEEIVTQLLSSNEILKTDSKNFYITNPKSTIGNLGLFLSNNIEPPPYEYSKYSFIKIF